MKFWLYILPSLLLLSGCLPQGSLRTSYRSEALSVDRYITDLNPLRTAKKILPIEGQPGELVWLTAAEIEVFEDGTTKLLPQLMSMTSLDMAYTEWHNKRLRSDQDQRLFQLDRGTSSFALPPGFGIPISSNEPLNWTAQSSNFDAYLPRTVVRQNLILGISRQRGLDVEMKAIRVCSFQVKHGGSPAWSVPSNGLTVTLDLSNELEIEEEVKIHGLVACLGSGATEIRLLESSTQQVLLSLKTRLDAKGQVEKNEVYSDPQGIPLDPTQRYQMEIRFENPNQVEIQTSSSLSVYLSDPGFQRP